MDKLTCYRQIIKEILLSYAEFATRHSKPEIQTEVVFDEERDHYMLVKNGWDGRRRHRGTTVYVRIRNNKFWIEEDWLEEGIATDLLAAGVPNEDIVLAFQHPSKRPYTEFAAA